MDTFTRNTRSPKLQRQMDQFFRSFMYAVNGIRVSWHEQRNLKIQSIIALVVVAAAFYFEITLTEWCVVLFAIGLVMALEMVNSAIESLVDLVTRERNELAGKIKDIAAGAVLLASIIAMIIGILVFGKYLLN
jgi:diacylglycerol kinase (ATP)